jgi:hypothetical protein
MPQKKGSYDSKTLNVLASLFTGRKKKEDKFGTKLNTKMKEMKN